MGQLTSAKQRKLRYCGIRDVARFSVKTEIRAFVSHALSSELINLLPFRNITRHRTAAVQYPTL